MGPREQPNNLVAGNENEAGGNKKRVSSDSLKNKKNTRRRLSISTADETPNENDEIRRSIEELKANEDRFDEHELEGDQEAAKERQREMERLEGIEKERTRREQERRNIERKEQERLTRLEREREVEREKERQRIIIKKMDRKEESLIMRRNFQRRSSVAGMRADHSQEEFENKCVRIKGSVDSLNENGIGYVCRKGLKPESPNQDDFIIITMENLSLYAIFDGHGPYGHDVSNFVQRELPHMIIENENFLTNPKEVFHNAFLAIHEQIEKTTVRYLKKIEDKEHKGIDGLAPTADTSGETGYSSTPSAADSPQTSPNLEEQTTENENDEEEAEEEEEEEEEDENTSEDNTEGEGEKTKKKKKKNVALFDSTMSGTTATVIVHLQREKKLYIAYVGDSRAVLGKRDRNDTKKLVAMELTKDHKPNSEGEKARILNSGGDVMKLEGDIPYRVFIKNKYYPGLAMSRALGDTIGHQIGVISDPDFIEVDIKEDEDLLVLICSDGVWEFISSQEAINLVYDFGYDKVQEAVENLARVAWRRWINEEENIVDDITIQAVYLSDKSRRKAT